MSNCLVTGGAGFIGSHVADELLKQGHRVLVLDDLSGGFRESVPNDARFFRGNVTSEDLVERLFKDWQFDYVFHLAAYAAEGLSHFIRRFNYTNNLIGSVNLINAAVKHGCKGFVFTSSIAVYGSAHTPMYERVQPRPEDPYGIAKCAVEMDLEAARRMFGLNYIVFRPHNVYGERQNIGDRYRNVIGIFMNQILRGEPMTIFGDGSQTREFSYVGDVAPLIARSIESPEAFGRTYNIGSDESVSVGQLAAMVAGAMQAHGHVRYLPERLEVKHALASHERIEREFGYSAKTPLADGLARMAAWAKRRGPQDPTRFEAVEVEKNLPAVWSEVCV
jgi:UDP-glucose 4-epimerase